jgi:hypothetical protein
MRKSSSSSLIDGKEKDLEMNFQEFYFCFRLKSSVQLYKEKFNKHNFKRNCERYIIHVLIF